MDVDITGCQMDDDIIGCHMDNRTIFPYINLIKLLSQSESDSRKSKTKGCFLKEKI